MAQQVTSATRPRVRIEIDLNSRDANGHTPAYLDDADGYIAVGDVVTAFESEDEVAAPATVRRIAHGVAYLDVDWGAMTDDATVPTLQPKTVYLADRRQATSSAASYIRYNIVAPLLVSAAAVAATAGGIAPAPNTTAPNSLRPIAAVMEAGETA
ncbi:hypothetical protein R2B67_17995 [Streptomyces cyaneofuscatus]|uniref:hypothetical protein n=1 Tax=Streptomyces cyaneofuscatus TaxID=66883 RepID=UPI002953602B|nr:hypothetical protein [Streptomyces cyaneofuscatus]WOP10316.1 hypothetical protein R2B67_17995 [Streptomyces cyaneofuscatus]